MSNNNNNDNINEVSCGPCKGGAHQNCHGGTCACKRLFYHEPGELTIPDASGDSRELHKEFRPRETEDDEWDDLLDDLGGIEDDE